VQQTEFPFTLPFGYVDADGKTHREGSMRLATAYDEIAPLRDPRVQANPGYLVIILLSRVMTRLGEVEHINPKLVEELFAGDLAYSVEAQRRMLAHITERNAIMREVAQAGGVRLVDLAAAFDTAAAADFREDFHDMLHLRPRAYPKAAAIVFHGIKDLL